MSETIEARVKTETITAMKARDGERTTTLRLITTALKNKAIEKRASSEEAVTAAEEQQVLASMIKQRRDSIEQFTKGGRPELAAKETAEIAVIEEFLPKALSAEELQALVGLVVAQIAEGAGQKPGPKEMGTVIKAVQAKLAADGLRAEGRAVSEMVKAALA
ncbi:GatB/YqeY domain-containing protein [Acidicapsa dinghuensis]|uniref:GatB/YqeY domain-containing protein n=1 Tax=Acidicapsa dinghuensis TaxID=2218256 RepID=A0ABW1E9X3_9BACT|nr:GatB/YqeY domain-containing protein [Acidicapsa dinghuensis]